MHIPNTMRFEAAVSGLALAITAPNDADANLMIAVAEHFAAGLSKAEIEKAKAQALIKADELEMLGACGMN